MSRIGKMPILVSDKVNVKVELNTITVKWPLWELSFVFSSDVSVSFEWNQIAVSPKNDNSGAIWWTTRAVINNMVVGVTEGYKKSLEINWVGYKFELQWTNKIILSAWFSHKVEIDVPTTLKVTPDEKFKNTIHITWIDKQIVWEFASKIRANKPPEPYKWKWIKYVWEHVRRKAGKAGKSGKK